MVCLSQLEHRRRFSQLGGEAVTAPDPLADLSELAALRHRLSEDARQSLLRIAGAKVAPDAGGWLDRLAPRMKRTGG